MFKRVRNLFSRQSESVSDTEKSADPSGLSGHKDDVETVSRKSESYTGISKKNYRMLNTDSARPSSEWYTATTTNKSEPDKGDETKKRGTSERGTNESINPTFVSYGPGLVESRSPVETRKKISQKTKAKSKSEFVPGISKSEQTKVFAKNTPGRLLKKKHDNADEGKFGSKDKQIVDEELIAGMRATKVTFSESQQVILTQNEMLPHSGTLSTKKLSQMKENREKFMKMDIQTKRHYYKCGKNFLTSDQIPSWEETNRNMVVDESINKAVAEIPRKTVYEPNGIFNQKVALWYGDITRLELDVAVNSTSSLLLDEEMGVNGAIRKAAGPELDLDLEEKWQIKTGSVFKTCGYRLPAQRIYHVSGPSNYFSKAAMYLSQCYTNALESVKQDHLRTIAFPCISAGNKGLPFEFSANVALSTVRDWLKDNHEHVDKVIFCVFDELTWQIYIRKMHSIFPAVDNESKDDHTSQLPAEILLMDKKSVELYKKALEEGKEKDYSIRVMVTGPYGVGKSTFTKRLLFQDVDISERHSTDGIDVHVNKCKVSLETSEWIVDHADLKENNTVQRLSKVLKSTRDQDVADKFTEKETGIHDNVIEQESRSEGNPKEENVGELAFDELDGGQPKNDDIENDASGLVAESLDDVDGSHEDDRLKHEEMLLKDLREVLQVADKGDTDELADVSIWDFGGQFVFYTTHQMFLSRRAVYILVNNMSQHINDVVLDDEPYFDCSGSKCLRIEDFLDIWLNSIHGHSDRERQGTPPVILVGTHADKLDTDTRETQIEAVFDAIRYRFVGKDVSLHFIDKDFGLRNDVIDPKLDDLRKTISDVAKQQPYWGELKPAKWIPLERLLEELRRKDVEIMSYTDVERLNQTLPVPLAADELDLFLRFQHETACIMYFSVPELQNSIVLSPPFLVNALKSLITAEMFCKKKAEIMDKWMEFRQKGVLRTSLIDAVWSREENVKFLENKDHILTLMEHLNIIARPVLYTDDDEDTLDHDHNYYLVPCMLKESPPESVFHAEEPFISTSCLCLDLENVAFPSAIFNRLLVGCMACWPLAKSGKKYHIYCGCGQFDVDVQHRLTLAFRSKVISLRITRFGQTNRHPSPSICDNVYRTIKQILDRIRSYLSLTLTYKEYIQCPLSAKGSMTCMHSIEKLKSCDEFPCHEHDAVTILHSCDLLRYWFEMADTDHINSPDDSLVPSVLNTATLIRVPTEKELVKISHGIGLEFQQLFLELGISNARIGQIRGSNPLSVADQVVQLLLEWRKQRDCLATFRELETAMNSVGTDTLKAFKDIHQ